MQPCLQTQRLTLRPFTVSDAPDVERLAGDIRVARTASAIPHPYPKGAAATWIATHQPEFESGKRVVFAITATATGELLGAIDLLGISRQHARCEIGYWVAHRHWSTGICTEATLAMIDYAQTAFGISRVVARCLASNVGSRRVMEKAGLVLEGRLHGHVSQEGVFEDLLLFGRVLPGRDTRPVQPIPVSSTGDAVKLV